MNVNCSTCLELLTPSDDLSCPPCGHTFHTQCIEQCLESTKKCPMCRATLRSNGLRRVFLTQGADLSGTQADSSVLQSRIDQLTFDKRLLEAEKKKAVEGCEKATVQAVGLRAELRELEAKLSYAKEEAQTYKAQKGLMLGEKKKAERAKKEAEELQEKLNLYKKIEFIVQGSAAEVNQSLHKNGDYSKATKDLTYMMVALRKEFDAKSKETTQYRKESAARHSKLMEVRASLEMVQQSNATLSSDNSRLTEDNRHLEEEVTQLKAKLSSLQDAMGSPSGDVRQSVINRLINEYPAPQHVGISPRQTTTSQEAPKKRRLPDADENFELKKAKSFDLPLLEDSTNFNLSSKPKKVSNPFASHKLPMTSQPQSKKTNLLLRNIREMDAMTSPVGLNYDGFGGRSRIDSGFPVPLAKDNFKIKTTQTLKYKKPKGVSRPKQTPLDSLASSSSSTIGTKSIDSFFSPLESS